MVEISKAFEYEDFTAFDRVRFPKVSRIGSGLRFAGCRDYGMLKGKTQGTQRRSKEVPN